MFLLTGSHTERPAVRVLLVIASAAAGALTYHAAVRYGPRILWHIFTTDTRSTR